MGKIPFDKFFQIGKAFHGEKVSGKKYFLTSFPQQTRLQMGVSGSKNTF